jgi:hypothetical protein
MMKARTKMAGLVLLVVALSAGGLPIRLGHAAPHASYRNRVLQVVVPGPELQGRIDYLLNRHATGYQINSDSKTAYIKDFRCSLGDGEITIRFSYDAKTRGWTWVRKYGIAGPKQKAYGPWVKDSGWIEVDVHTGVHNGMLIAYTRNGYVRWGSNNWFTNQFRDLFDQKIRDSVADSVNAAVAEALGGRNVPPADVLLRYGAAEIGRAFGVSRAVAENTIRNAIRRSNPNAKVTSQGVVIQVVVPDGPPSGSNGGANLPFTFWRYYEGGNPGYFQKRGARWVEVKGNRVYAQFQQSGVTPSEVELYDLRRRMWVRLTGTRCYWSTDRSRWHYLYNRA